MNSLHQPHQLDKENQHREAYVDVMPRLTGPIQIVDYQANWSELFQKEADNIRQILGNLSDTCGL